MASAYSLPLATYFTRARCQAHMKANLSKCITVSTQSYDMQPFADNHLQAAEQLGAGGPWRRGGGGAGGGAAAGGGARGWGRGRAGGSARG